MKYLSFFISKKWTDLSPINAKPVADPESSNMCPGSILSRHAAVIESSELGDFQTSVLQSENKEAYCVGTVEN